MYMSCMSSLSQTNFLLPGRQTLILVRRMNSSHGHKHSDPPHFAYKGKGLPRPTSLDLNSFVHMHNRQVQVGITEPPRASTVPLYRSTVNVEARNIEFMEQLQQLYNRVLTADWHDQVSQAQNVMIWEGALYRLKRRTGSCPDLHVQLMLSKVLELFDVMYQAEDVADHVYQLSEELNRGSILDDQIQDHMDAVLAQYNYLMKTYPDYALKIQTTVGQAIASIRQKIVFDCPQEFTNVY